ncbi:hypothetical protein P7C71_g159, partial [Lecanoromycetidae sp. Uapishka_2]
MQYRMIAVAMPLFVASSFAQYGQATVKNSCGDPAYFWACGDTEGPKVTIAPGSSHSETYSSKSDGGGLSYKVTTNYPGTSSGPNSIYDLPQPNITQFEVTVGSPGPPAKKAWFDASNINGYPFLSGGISITASDGSVNVACPKDVLYCQAAYNAPHDDHATGNVDESVNLTMELCSDAPGVMAAGENSSSSSDSSEESSDEVSSAAPVASTTAVAPAATQAAPQVQQKQEVKQQDQQASPPQTNEKVAEHAAVDAAPSPTTTPAPSTPDEDPVIVWVTHTAAPEIVTVHLGPDGQSWDSKAKRDQHVHQHVHNKINKKRHGGL